MDHIKLTQKLNIRPLGYKETLQISAYHYTEIDASAKNNEKIFERCMTHDTAKNYLLIQR